MSTQVKNVAHITYRNGTPEVRVHRTPQDAHAWLCRQHMARAEYPEMPTTGDVGVDHTYRQVPLDPAPPTDPALQAADGPAAAAAAYVRGDYDLVAALEGGVKYPRFAAGSPIWVVGVWVPSTGFSTLAAHTGQQGMAAWVDAWVQGVPGAEYQVFVARVKGAPVRYGPEAVMVV